jgi:hypothetical protein
MPTAPIAGGRKSRYRMSLRDILAQLFRRPSDPPPRRTPKPLHQSERSVRIVGLDGHTLAGGSLDQLLDLAGPVGQGTHLAARASAGVRQPSEGVLPELRGADGAPAAIHSLAVLRDRAAHDPAAATAYATLLILNHNRLPMLLRDSAPTDGAAADSHGAFSVGQVRARLAEEIARVLPLVPAADRGRLPPLEPEA